MQEQVEVTALSGDHMEIPATADTSTSLASLPRRSDITLSPASHHDIEEIFRTGSEPDNDLEAGSNQQGASRRQLLVPGSPVSGDVPASRSKLHAFLARTDARTVVGQFQNNQHLAQERLPANLPRFKESVAALHVAVRNPGIPQKEREELSRLTLDLMQKIDRVATEQAMSHKLATKLLFSMASIGLCILPLLTANKNKDFQYMAMLIAGYAKTMLMLVGLGLSRTADAATYGTHLKERHIPYLIPTLPYALSAFNKQAENFEHQHPVAFNGTAAAFIGTMFLLSSAPHLVTGPLNAMYDKVRGHFDSNRDAGTTSTPEALTAQLQEDIGMLADAFRTQHEAMIQRRDELEEGGGQLSDALSNQVSDIDQAAMKLDDSLKKLLGGDTPEPVVHANNDLSQKVAFTILAAVLCVGSASTYYDEMVGLIDLGADAALTIGELTKTALNPAETAQRAAEKFASYSGMAPLLLPFGIINKIPATHFTDSMAGLVVGTILLTCANATLPRPTAEFLAQAIMKVMDRIKAARAEQPEGGAAQGTEMASGSSVTITELDDGDDAIPGAAIDIATNDTGQAAPSGPQAESDRLDIVIDQGETLASTTTKGDQQ